MAKYYDQLKNLPGLPHNDAPVSASLEQIVCKSWNRAI